MIWYDMIWYEWYYDWFEYQHISTNKPLNCIWSPYSFCFKFRSLRFCCHAANLAVHLTGFWTLNGKLHCLKGTVTEEDGGIQRRPATKRTSDILSSFPIFSGDTLIVCLQKLPVGPRKTSPIGQFKWPFSLVWPPCVCPVRIQHQDCSERYGKPLKSSVLLFKLSYLAGKSSIF